MFFKLKKTLHDLFSSNLVKLDLDLDPDPDSDPRSEKLLGPDEVNADPQPCKKGWIRNPDPYRMMRIRIQLKLF